jgi:LmbE family N-acetylglucosaminyl deacetylase
MAVVLFVAPHQDDETLSMGSAIRKHLEVGVHDVHVMLLTDGSGSAAQPATGLDTPGFCAARDDEFRRACRALGVRAENVHLPTGRPAGGLLTPELASCLIGCFVAAHPDVWVKTYSNRVAPGRHADHIAAGQAAVNMLTTGVLGANTVRLYVEPWLIAAWRTANPGVTASPERASSPTRTQRAMDEYGDVDHTGFRYGIGHLSVGSIFTSLRPDPVNYYHVP